MDLQAVHALAPDAKKVLVNARQTVTGDAAYVRIAEMMEDTTARYPGGVNFAPVKFKPWSTLFVNLSEYAGKKLFLEFITTDCTKRGHFGYAYVDVLECQTPVSAETVCGGRPLTTLKGPPGFASYQWWNRDFTRRLGTGQNITLSPPLAQDELAQVIFTPYGGFGCLDTVSTPIRVTNLQPGGIRYPTVKTLANIPTPLEARNIGTGFLWTPATGLDNPRIQKPVFRFDRNMGYLIELSARDGCNMVDTLDVVVFERADIFVPSAFSPNDDGHNDYLDIFTPGMREIRFWVFNRWGQLMFETKDPRQRWDGYFKGNRQPLETYVWIAEGITMTGERIRRRGQTVLIR
jgi:gliding motility-associated-like protein